MTKDVIAVECLDGFRLVLTFEGGERREIDLGPILSFKGVFEPLRDPDYFRQVGVNPDVGTIVWPNGADVCPDVLYEWSIPAARTSPSAR
jgi:hypothetical protein